VKKVFIIAEAGVNHNGSLLLAKRIVDAAKKAGADAVKFQTYVVENLCSNHALTAKYQSKKKKSQKELLNKLSLTFKENIILKKYCNSKKIIFLSSAFDLESLQFLLKLKLKYYKIPSGQINDLPYLKMLGKCNQKILLSTGMSSIKEIKNAINYLISHGTIKKNITLLHCNSAYPTPYEDLNLNAIPYLRKKIKIKVGFSDHSKGIIAPRLSVALGASVIEKHITLKKTMTGPDHKSSLNPREFYLMIKSIRVTEKVLGQFSKKITLSEKRNLKYVRKSIVAQKNIIQGEKFSLRNITTKRPCIGISPLMYFKLIGKKAKRNYKYDQIINRNELN
jgi:N,N'-diacetyllegionaminate synthase